jgi:hypothetical protein
MRLPGQGTAMAVIRHMAERYMLYPLRQLMTNTLPMIFIPLHDGRSNPRIGVCERVLPDWFRRRADLSSLILLSIPISAPIAIRIHRVSTR